MDGDLKTPPLCTGFPPVCMEMAKDESNTSGIYSWKVGVAKLHFLLLSHDQKPFFTFMCFFFPLYRLSFPWNYGGLTFQERRKFYPERVAVLEKEIGSRFFFPQMLKRFLCVTPAGIGQNFQNEVSVQRSILPEFVAYQFIT